MPGRIPLQSTPRLTGRKRFRSSWRGKLILQVEVEQKTGFTGSPGVCWTGKAYGWRDATFADIQDFTLEGTNEPDHRTSP